ncbi:MAG: hypothetical protein PVSMB10_18140 [Pseudarthrobacter sp.]
MTPVQLPVTPPTPATRAATTGQTPPVSAGAQADLKAALEAANAAIKAGQTALAGGDFAAYGEEQKKLAAALQKALDAEGKIPAPAPGATPAPEATPSASPSPSASK